MRNFDVEARIANPPESLLAKHTKKEKEFFYDYAAFVQRLLNSGQIKDRLRGLIETESIDPGRAIDLRIMVFPARPMTGRPRNILHGSFNQDTSQISLYPLKLPREWVRSEGYSMFKTALTDLSASQQKTLREVLVSAITTLIIFSVRGGGDCEKAREEVCRGMVRESFLRLPEPPPESAYVWLEVAL